VNSHNSGQDGGTERERERERDSERRESVAEKTREDVGSKILEASTSCLLLLIRLIMTRCIATLPLSATCSLRASLRSERGRPV
jgi:hypothetical protein